MTGTRIGNYRVLRKLGEGGMGSVYEALHEQIGHRAAIKVLHSVYSQDPEMAARFLNEARAVNIVKHSGLVGVYEFGQTPGGSLYIVMEYLEGETLRDRIARAGRLGADALRLGRQIATALGRAHQKGIVHRDLKPANVMIVPDEEAAGGERVKVLDFGIAKVAEIAGGELAHLKTRTGMLMGTPAYMAPEQCRGAGGVDERADVYALGVILYEMLVGSPPFLADGPGEIIAMHLFRQPTPVQQVDPAVPAALAGLIDQMLAKSPAQRPSMSMVAAALDQHQGDGSAAPRPAPSSLDSSVCAEQGRRLLLAHAPARAMAYLAQAYQAAQTAPWVRFLMAGAADEVCAHRLILSRADGPLCAATMSPDGAWILTAGEGDAPRLFQASTGHLRATLSGHQGAILCAALSPDAAWALTGGADGEVRCWDLVTGAPAAVLRGHSGSVRFVAAGLHGGVAVSAGDDGAVRVWDPRRGSLLHTIRAHGAPVRAASLSGDGALLVTASDDGTGAICEVRSGKVCAVLHGHAGPLRVAAFSHNGLKVATASLDLSVRLWDGRTGAALAVLSGHYRPVTAALFSPDGLRLITTSEDQSVRIWDGQSGQPLLCLDGHGGPVRAAALSPDGFWLVTAGDDGTARLWDAWTGALLSVLEGHQGGIRALAFRADGACLLTAGEDGTARVWHPRGRLLLTLDGHRGVVPAVCFSPDGARLLSASSDRFLRLWEAKGRLLSYLGGPDGGTSCAALHPDGLRVATDGPDGTVRVWELASGKAQLVLKGHGDGVHAAAFSPDGGKLATGGADRTARIWDARSGKAQLVLKGHGDGVYAVAFSPDGSKLATGSADRTARIWDAGTGALLMTLQGHGGKVSDVRFSPDGGQLLTACADGGARIFAASDGRPRVTFSGHIGPVHVAAFTPGGDLVVTGGDDRTARVWDARSGVALAHLTGHGGAVTALSVSPDGGRLLTGSVDQTARLWDIRQESRGAAELMAVLRAQGSYRLEGERVVPAMPDPTAIPASSALQVAQDPATALRRVRNLMASGGAALGAGNLAVAEGHYQQAMSLGQVLRQPLWEGECLLSLGLIAQHRRDPGRALGLWQRAEPLFAEQRAEAHEVAVLQRLAGVAHDGLYDPETALRLHDMARRLQPFDPAILLGRAESLVAAGRWDDYLREVRYVLEVQTVPGYRVVLDGLAWAAATMAGRSTEAQAWAQQTMADYAQLQPDQAIQWVFTGTRHALAQGQARNPALWRVLDLLSALEQPVNHAGRTRLVNVMVP